MDYAIKMKKTWSISQEFTIHFFHMGYAVILQTFCDKMGLFIISWVCLFEYQYLALTKELTRWETEPLTWIFNSKFLGAGQAQQLILRNTNFDGSIKIISQVSVTSVPV